jgi:predicted DNA-binding transcriptional regulator AlpA
MEVVFKDDLAEIIQTTVRETIARVQPVHHPSIMNRAQLRAYLGKPESTIKRYMREGMPYRKDGTDHPEFYKKDIDAWIEKRFQQIEMEVVQ